MALPFRLPWWPVSCCLPNPVAILSQTNGAGWVCACSSGSQTRVLPLGAHACVPLWGAPDMVGARAETLLAAQRAAPVVHQVAEELPARPQQGFYPSHTQTGAPCSGEKGMTWRQQPGRHMWWARAAAGNIQRGRGLGSMAERVKRSPAGGHLIALHALLVRHPARPCSLCER